MGPADSAEAFPDSLLTMRGLLIRVGADSTEGGGRWNAPCDAKTGRYCYVPIPESKETVSGLETSYSAVEPALQTFGTSLPAHLTGRRMHLDPDFSHLTYGDRGRKGQQLATTLSRGDLLVFFGGFRDIATRNLMYAIFGLFVVSEVARAANREARVSHTNAHTRRVLARDADDVIVIGEAGVSGRLDRLLPIGEYRSRAYRVAVPMLEAWGGLSSHDGYLQRSAVFPEILDSSRFKRWLDGQYRRTIEDNGH